MKTAISLLNAIILSFLLFGCGSGTLQMYSGKKLADTQIATLIPNGVQITSVDGNTVRAPRGAKLRHTQLQLKPGEYLLSILVDDGSQFDRKISSSVKVKAKLQAGHKYNVKPMYLENLLWCPSISSADGTISEAIVFNEETKDRICSVYNPNGAKGFDIIATTFSMNCTSRAENNPMAKSAITPLICLFLKGMIDSETTEAEAEAE